ncbi:MAG: hypothetical protein AB8E15_11675 [Bdellovibrionales bacterium]
MRVIIALVLGLSLSLNVMARRHKKIPLDPPRLQQVNQILSESSDLGLALFSQKDDQVKQELTELNIQIRQILSSLGDFELQNQEMHLKRILLSTKNNLETYENINTNDKKRVYLKKAFAQITQLVRMYKVDKKFRIFYCKDDNAEWVQTERKARNPVSPDRFGRCGMRPYR